MKTWDHYKSRGDWEPFAAPLGFVRLILLVDWDPIGVFGYESAMNEYDSYAVGVYNLLTSDASPEALVAHLRRIEVEAMGLRGSPETQLAAVAAKLREAFETGPAAAERRAELEREEIDTANE